MPQEVAKSTTTSRLKGQSKARFKLEKATSEASEMGMQIAGWFSQAERVMTMGEWSSDRFESTLGSMGHKPN